jgi:hypothetical protein
MRIWVLPTVGRLDPAWIEVHCRSVFHGEKDELLSSDHGVVLPENGSAWDRVKERICGGQS